MGRPQVRVTKRPDVLFVSWAFVRGRCTEIADALGGSAASVYDPRFADRRLAPLRYVVSSVITMAVLLWRRPASVIATNPPVFPGLVAWLYGAVAGVPVVLDSHPGAFGRKGDAISERMLPVHRWLARRVRGVLVTTEDFVAEVESWGGRGLVVHEAPPGWDMPPAPSVDAPVVLVVSVFAKDEPMEAVFDAARSLPEVTFVVTGDPRKAPPGLVEAAPENVDLVGFVPQEEYLGLIERANIVISLTTEPNSIMRSAYEAVYALRPLIVSDWPALREVFPFAEHAANDPSSLARAVGEVLNHYPSRLEVTEPARRIQLARWDDQIGRLRRMLAIDAPSNASSR